MREERITVGRHELVIARPDDPESLIDESRFEQDEFLPYWAGLWPSGIALAAHVAGLDLTGRRVLELGCGLALPSFAAALGGGEVLASDWAPEALALVATNAATNGLRVETALVDWHAALPSTPGAEPGRHDVVLAADVLYEERNAESVLGMLTATTAAEGMALVADPGRRHAGAFFDLAAADGWSIEHLSAAELPSGTIAMLRRVTSTRG